MTKQQMFGKKLDFASKYIWKYLKIMQHDYYKLFALQERNSFC